jgi:hypothetical protein
MMTESQDIEMIEMIEMIEIESPGEITEMTGSMTEGTAETDKEADLVKIETEKTTRTPNKQPTRSHPLKSQCQYKSQCLQSLAKGLNVVDNVLAHLSAIIGETKITTKASSGIHSHGCLESMRRLMITNIPYEMGIEKEDLR